MRSLLGAALLAAATSATAGRPLTTEDAAVLEAGACQLEAWIDRSRVATQVNAVPACNFGLGVEWQLGAQRTREAGRSAMTEALFQGKLAFVSVDEHPWGVGLVAGALRRAQRETANGWGDPYAIVPLSFKLGENENLLHLNLGWSRDRAERRNLTLWGLAVEVPVGERLALVAESYGENAREPWFRAGGRFAAIKDRLDFDLTFVARSGGAREERFVSLGLRYQTAAFLR